MKTAGHDRSNPAATTGAGFGDGSPEAGRIAPESIDVIAPHLGRRFSGITSTLERVLPEQAKSLSIVTMGPTLPASVPKIGFRDIRGLRGKPAKFPFRVWHARRNDDLLLGLFLRDLMRMPLKLVFTSASQRRHSMLTRFLIKRADAIIATSKESASYLSRSSTVVPHGMDTETYRPGADRPALRARLGLPDRLLIGCFGRIRPDKGTNLFADAWLAVALQEKDAVAVVTGLTKSHYLPFERAIRKKIAEHGLSDRLHWLGEQPSERMPELYRALDIYVAPQRWEGFGVTPLEAMASGVPVVATTVGTFASQIVDGVTGLLVPPNDVPALEAAIMKLVRDPELRRAMGEAGRRHVETRFSIASEAEGINAVYRALWRGDAT